ncbi:MAG TPA: hypothetical protein VGL89_01085 [Candidatus Koribacter sp.]|jgi:hypothetical protein
MSLSITRRILVAFFSVSFVAALCAQETFEPKEKMEAGPQERQEWFYHQRAFPFAHTPAGAHRRAFGEAMQMRINEQQRRASMANGIGDKTAFTFATTAGTNPWTLVGPRPSNQGGYGYGLSSGRITTLAVDQSTSGTSTVIYAGGAEGGVWKSTDNGTTWNALTDDQPTLAIGSITIDPNNHLNLYAGTGEQNFSGDSYYGGGILHSTDGGSHWSMLGAAYFGGPTGSDSYFNGGSYIGAVAVQPSVSSGSPIILAGAQFSTTGSSGIYRSTDGGTTWTQVGPTGGTPTGAYYSVCTAVFWVSKTKAYAAMSNPFGLPATYGVPEGVYVSTDSGATWTATNGASGHQLPYTNASAGRISLVYAPSSVTTLYASFADNANSGLLNMYVSTDGGANWNPLAHTPLNGAGTGNDFCGTQCWYDMVLAVSPSNPSVLYAGGSLNYSMGNGGLYVTINGGTSWATPNPGTNGVMMHPDFHAIAFSTTGSTVNAIYIGNDGGVWTSTNVNSSTMALTDLNNNLAITEFYPGLSLDPSNKNTALNGTQDNGTQLYSGVSEWTVVACGDGAWTAIDFNNASNMYTGCTPGNGGPYRSLSGGSIVSWTDISTGISPSDSIAFIPPMVMDPNSSTTLYYGTNRVYKMTGSTGGSPSWSPTTAGAISAGTLTSIAVAPGHANYIFVADSNGVVQFSTTTGTSWTTVPSVASTGILPVRYATMVQADPHTYTTFYATFSGFAGYGDNGHVFQCSTTSNTCSDITGNLPNSPANDIVIDPDFANTYYVATDVGVYYTTDGGSTWATAGTGLPNVAVVGMKLHEGARILRAATHGRSTWDLQLPSASITPAVISSPTPGTKLSNSSPTFMWNSVSGASSYTLSIGTTVGGSNILNATGILTTSYAASGLPTNGEKLYVKLTTVSGGNNYSNSYNYYASGTGTAATISSPAANSKLSGSSQLFSWTTGTGISSYQLLIGSTVGGSDIYSSGTVTSTSATASPLPTNGEKLYVTLKSLNGATYLTHAYNYYASGTGTAGVITSPAANSKLSSNTNVEFQWSAGTGITEYELYIGSTYGGSDLAKVTTKNLNYTVASLPNNGEKLYVQLKSLNGASWLTHSYNYYCHGTGTAATLTSPAPNSHLSTSTNVEFQWAAGTGITEYELYVGTTYGGSDLAKVTTKNLNYTIASIPANGAKLYIALKSLNGASWLEHTYNIYAESGPSASKQSPDAAATTKTGSR